MRAKPTAPHQGILNSYGEAADASIIFEICSMDRFWKLQMLEVEKERECFPWNPVRISEDLFIFLTFVCMCVVSISLQPPWTVARQAPRSGGLFQAGILERVAIASSSFFPSSVLFATLREAAYLEGVAVFQRLLKTFFFYLQSTQSFAFYIYCLLCYAFICCLWASL